MALAISLPWILSVLMLVSFGIPQMEHPLSQENPYEACCGLEPVVFKVGAGSVYIPNVVTPNGDAINDVFNPIINKGIGSVRNFIIRDGSGNSIIFQKANLDVAEPSKQATVLPDGWNGKNEKGQPHRGLFRYSMAVYDLNGFTQVIHGTACSVLCDSSAIILRKKPGCFYPVQQNANGELDASLPNLINHKLKYK